MNKVLKIVLILTLALVLAVGTYFGVSASDEDDPNGCAKVEMVA